MTALIEAGPGERHYQWDICVRMHPRDGRVHPRDMHWSLQDGFSLLLPAADTVQILGESINISRIAMVPQANHQPHLILNLSEKSDKGTPSVNETAEREVAPESMHIGRDFPRILQAI